MQHGSNWSRPITNSLPIQQTASEIEAALVVTHCNCVTETRTIGTKIKNPLRTLGRHLNILSCLLCSLRLSHSHTHRPTQTFPSNIPPLAHSRQICSFQIKQEDSRSWLGCVPQAQGSTTTRTSKISLQKSGSIFHSQLTGTHHTKHYSISTHFKCCPPPPSAPHPSPDCKFDSMYPWCPPILPD